MQARRYQGKLFFDAVDHLDVSALILRDREIGFSLACVTKAHGRWVAESGTVAVLQPDGRYLAKGERASQQGVAASNPWDIVFQVDFEDPGKVIEISGSLHDAGDWTFEGELLAF